MTCENPWREGPGHQLFSDSGELLEKAWLPWFQRCVWRRLLKKLGFSFVVCQFCFMITLSAAGFRVETLGIGETYQADLRFVFWATFFMQLFCERIFFSVCSDLTLENPIFSIQVFKASG